MRAVLLLPPILYFWFWGNKSSFSTKMLICHNWNHRAVPAEEKGEKYRRKIQFYALPDLNSGFSNMNIPGLCCWTVLPPIGLLFLMPFLCFCWWSATAVAERTAEGKDQSFYGEKLQEQLGAWLAEWENHMLEGKSLQPWHVMGFFCFKAALNQNCSNPFYSLFRLLPMIM